MNSIRLNIDGLQEMETQERVKNQLAILNGVCNVACSAGQNYVDLKYNEEISEAEIENHLQNNGYKVIEREHLS